MAEALGLPVDVTLPVDEPVRVLERVDVDERLGVRVGLRVPVPVRERDCVSEFVWLCVSLGVAVLDAVPLALGLSDWLGVGDVV